MPFRFQGFIGGCGCGTGSGQATWDKSEDLKKKIKITESRTDIVTISQVFKITINTHISAHAYFTANSRHYDIRSRSLYLIALFDLGVKKFIILRRPSEDEGAGVGGGGSGGVAVVVDPLTKHTRNVQVIFFWFFFLCCTVSGRPPSSSHTMCIFS